VWRVLSDLGPWKLRTQSAALAAADEAAGVTPRKTTARQASGDRLSLCNHDVCSPSVVVDPIRSLL
jgi:hypothetical protein